MKVILIQDVKNLGKKDSTVEVNDGYARNFLFPKKLAIEANSTNMNLLSNKKNSEARKKDIEIANAKEIANKISSIEVIIKTKAGENGRLFGSITSKDIADILKNSHGVSIDKKKIELDETVKTLGNYNAQVKVYSGIVAKLKVNIQPE